MIDTFVDIFVGALLGLTIAVGTGPLWIPFFKRLKFGQFIREDGPQAHLAKSGTPTFGGLIFMCAIAIGGGLLLLRQGYYQTLFPIVSMFSYGLIGFSDDYLKVVKKQNLGLKARQKVFGLIGITLFLYFAYVRYMPVTMPFTEIVWTFGIVHFIFFAFVAVAITNAVNLTDGIDGLCASVTLVVSVFFIGISLVKGNLALAVMNGVVAGALVGYLFYNWHPAKVFMGDTGSLALGGLVLANAFALDIAWFIPIFGLIYVIETVSVIIQVVYFKRTGKRFFKMAPIHHHFEMLGWNEKRIAITASGITALLCVVSTLLIV